MDDLRRLIEQPQVVSFWGSEYKITPRLVGRVLGDGGQLIHLTPLNTRPNYYVARIDSRWGMSHRDDDPFIDHVEELYEAIEDEYGVADFECESCGLMGKSWDNCPCQAEREFPALDLECGSCWGPVEVYATPSGEGE